MNRICREMDRRMLDVLDGTVSLSDRMAFFDHLSECETCRTHYTREIAFRNALRASAPKLVLGDDFTAEVLKKTCPKKSNFSWRKWMPMVAAAACFVLTFAVFRFGALFTPAHDGIVQAKKMAMQDTVTEDAFEAETVEEASFSEPFLYSNQVVDPGEMRVYSTASPRERENTLLINMVSEVLTRYENDELSYYMNIGLVSANPDALYIELRSRFDLVMESDNILVFEATAQESVLHDYFASFGENLTELETNRLSRTGEDALLFVVLYPPYN